MNNSTNVIIRILEYYCYDLTIEKIIQIPDFAYNIETLDRALFDQSKHIELCDEEKKILRILDLLVDEYFAYLDEDEKSSVTNKTIFELATEMLDNVQLYRQTPNLLFLVPRLYRDEITKEWKD